MRSILALARRMKGYRRGFTVVTLAAIGVLFAGVIVAVAAVAYAAALTAGTPLLGWGIALGVGVLVAATLTWVEQWIAHVLAYRVIDALRIDVHRAVARLAPLGLAGRTSGDTVSRAVGDAEALEWFYAHTAAQVVAGLFASATFSVVAVVAVGAPGLIVPVAHILLMLVPLVSARSASRQGERMRQELSDLAATALQARQFARETVLLGRMTVLTTEVDARTARIQRIRRSIAIRQGLEQAASEIIGAALALAALGLVVAGIRSGALAPSSSPLVIVFALSSTSAALVVAGALGRFGEVGAAAARIDELLDAPSIRPDEATLPAVAAGDGTPGVDVEGVEVRYASAAGDVLRGVDLRAPAGRMIAVVGSSGAGKSTLLLAIARLIPTANGVVAIDGIPTATESGTRTRTRVAFVGQHAHVFRATVRDNLLAPDADDDSVWDALETAQLANRVRELPDGLDTVLNERGGGLSGGERQRLGLARGLLRRASVLLLDEPTAGLDPATEQDFLTTLRSVREDRAVIVATHRETVMQACDGVVLLDRGVVVDVGTHSELSQRSPTYRQLLGTSTHG